MVALTPISRKPVGFYVPVVAAAGAFAGLFVGTAQGSGLLGIVIGALTMGALAFILTQLIKKETIARWGSVILLAVIGFILGGVPMLVLGVIFGWFFGWFSFWLYEGRYRAKVAPYLTPGQVLWHFAFRIICGAILVFLITPILVVMPLSFNAENFFTFTPEMLRFDPEGYSLRHYKDFFNSSAWQGAVWNSVKIAPAATLLSVSFGTLAAIGLSQQHVPFRRAIMAILISPMIVPLIISVTATLVGFDRSLTRAAANMGANPVTTFFRVQMPLILPGVISGGLFAFITSFDEVVVVLFVGSAGQKTLPWQMFTGLREQISPTILAVATILVVISICLLTVVELLRRRSERLRGMSPG